MAKFKIEEKIAFLNITNSIFMLIAILTIILFGSLISYEKILQNLQNQNFGILNLLIPIYGVITYSIYFWHLTKNKKNL